MKKVICSKRGLTLIELLVTASILLIVLASLVSFLQFSSAGSSRNSNLSQAQSDVRYALSIITADIRAAGSTGIAVVNNQLNLTIQGQPVSYVLADTTLTRSSDGLSVENIQSVVYLLTAEKITINITGNVKGISYSEKTVLVLR